MALTDVPDIVRGRVGKPVETSNHSAIFINVVLEQPIHHLVCRQDVYHKNSVDWNLVRRDVNGLNWNGIINSPCPASSLNEAL